MNPISPSSSKVAVVSGGSRGIGRAIAKRLARDGAFVIFGYNSDQSAAAQTTSEIENDGGRTHAIQADFSNLNDITRFFDEVETLVDHIDFLINNAGIATFERTGDVISEGFDAIFGLNVRGLYFSTQRALPLLRDGGRIINISSGITRVNSPKGSVYAASKSAVEAFTRCWAGELGPRQITVNTLSPGMTETDLLMRITPPAVLEKMKKQTPLGRLGQPDDIADAVALLCSDDARWITAQNILASGGAA